MATIKSYTDLAQSKKLAEILPIESADMHYWLAWSGGVSEEQRNTPKVGTPNKDAIKTYWCPCWSLASLLGVLPFIDFTTPQLIGTPKTLYRCMYNDNLKSHAYDNPVDACYEMILLLHTNNLL